MVRNASENWLDLCAGLWKVRTDATEQEDEACLGTLGNSYRTPREKKDEL